MKMTRSVMASAITAAMLATSASPAMAQGYPGYGYGYGYGDQGYGHGDYDRYRRHNRGVSAGDVIAGVAIIGVLAAIAGAASKSNNGYRGNNHSADQAADACVSRIEQRYGNSAQVRNIDDVQRTRDGYFVRGTIETRGYNDRNTQRFTCSVRYGQVEDVRMDDYRGY